MLKKFTFLITTLIHFRRENIYNPGSKEYLLVQVLKKKLPSGWLPFLKRIVGHKKIVLQKKDMPWSEPLTSISKNLGKRVFIIAELSIPQCTKYRVDQKVEMLKLLGYETSVVSWTDAVLCRQMLQLHSLVIFYRVPATDLVIELLEEARRLGLTTFFDVDDLVFDRKLMLRNENINTLDKDELDNLLVGADLYQSLLSSVDHIISSTRVLGEQMRRYNKGELFIIKNCLDQQLLKFATNHPVSKLSNTTVTIVYGSGTSTHDNDFLEASNALIKLLEKHSNVKLYIHGTLNLPESFEKLSTQVIKVPFTDTHSYYSSLSNYDINIAPLEKSIFNDAKSNIKYLEASIFKIPTVASNAAEFKDVIINGENGLLADNDEQWLQSLEKLVLDKELRNKLGENAYHVALDEYNLNNVAQLSLKPLLTKYITQPEKKLKRILMVNVLFSPVSFGGATIVVEELAKLINKKEDFEVVVFTGFFDPGGYPIFEYGLIRYEANGLPVISVRFPEITPELEYKNKHMEIIFDDILKTVQPDLVHFHSIQQLSSSIAQSCQKQNIPYIITLHDMWWLCERQFMVMPQGKYCHQKKISSDFCISQCTKNKDFTLKRTSLLRNVLNKAELLVTPSGFQAEMYHFNDFESDKIKVNKNGIQFPAKKFTKNRTADNKIRFAYLGGNAKHKGYFFIKEIFENISASNYELILVDLHKKLGHSSIFKSDWNINGELTISDGYEYGQTHLDDFFSSIDVLLFPSQWKESFGLTIREALVRDVWVISTDAGGVIEDIIEEENGNIISMDDAEKFKERIEYCLENKSFFNNYKNPYKETIRSYNEQTNELLHFYDEIINKK